MAHFEDIPATARFFSVHPRTVHNWLDLRFITGYDDGTRQLKVDRDEVEAALKKNPRMRDGRKRHGNAHVVPLPITATGVER